MMNCRKHNVAASRTPKAFGALGYQSMIKQWISERMESELRERGNK
jgi:hypothetical protein